MDGVSFIVTVFDKRPYLPRVVAALARQTGPFARQFVFVDDGSSDGSAGLIRDLTANWKEPVIVLQQANAGASAATNRGVERATFRWLRLVDGDDLLVPGSTAALLAAARAAAQTLAYGDLGFYGPEDDANAGATPSWMAETVTDGLARFIRGCPSNSSTILVDAERYQAAGGCDERLVSPDQALFLRLFSHGDGIYLRGSVARAPEIAPGRLSGQRRRSRYESVLALHYLVTETPGLESTIARAACRRALSRAWRFHRKQGGRLASGHLLRFAASHLGLPLDASCSTYRALGAFTEDGRCERPSSWLPGALRGSCRETVPAR